MSTKAKLRLSPEQETLLITLYAKAQPGNRLLFDPRAEEILQRIDYDFDELRVPRKTVLMVCQRAKKLDAITRAFLNNHSNGVVVQVGCGLDSRFLRVGADGRVDWYDLDMPAVIELRRQFFADTERYHMIASSVVDWAWVQSVAAHGRPVLVVAEGLLMYLDGADVKQLVLKLREAFSGCQLVADVFSLLAARLAAKHPSLSHTGATMGWGLDDPAELEAWAPGIRLLEEWFFSDDPELARVGPGLRLVYKAAGAFKVVRRAHRIVHYQLRRADKSC